MVSRNSLGEVLDRLARGDNARVSVRVLALLLQRMGKDGRVTLTPIKIASALEAHHSQVYRALRSLAEMDAISMEQPSRRETRIRINPNLASMLPEDERLAAQAVAPEVGARAIKPPIPRRKRAAEPLIAA